MIKVLIVDDHLVVRNGLRLMLGTADDIRITAEAGTAREALRLLEVQEFHVAIIDISLPDKSGLDLIKLMKSQQPKLAVLVLSMYAEELYAVRAIKAGGAGYLTKDSPASTVVTAVRKAASGGKYLSATLVEQLADMVGGDTIPTHETLSDRELEVLKLIASGASLVQAAERLHLSRNTITTYRARIMEKMGFTTNIELARYAFEHRLVL